MKLTNCGKLSAIDAVAEYDHFRQSLQWGVHRTTQHCSAPRTPNQRTMISRMRAEYFGLAKDVAAIYALSRDGMHIKGIDMGLIFTQA